MSDFSKIIQQWSRIFQALTSEGFLDIDDACVLDYAEELIPVNSISSPSGEGTSGRNEITDLKVALSQMQSQMQTFVIKCLLQIKRPVREVLREISLR